MSTNYEELCKAVEECLSRRDSRRDLLAAKIRAIAEQACCSARLRKLDCGEAGVLEYRTPAADCSQWSNRIDYPNHCGEDVMMLRLGSQTIRSLGTPPDCGFFDGRNVQHQRGPTRDAQTGQRIRPATVAQLRSVARDLPVVVAGVLAAAQQQAEEEARQAEETIAALGK